MEKQVFYVTPEVEVIEIEVEQGFAISNEDIGQGPVYPMGF